MALKGIVAGGRVLKLTMFYDSFCPLCVAEVEQLRSLDRRGDLRFVDIHAEDFATRWPHIDPVAADRVLHAQLADGSMLYGLDVSAEVWATVGKHRWLRLLRLPVVRWFADLGYRLFARYRYSISFLLTGKRRCDTCSLERTDCGAPEASAND
jgi:predicted DCC family thiol-disulfide oxidoreductase YuxK